MMKTMSNIAMRIVITFMIMAFVMPIARSQESLWAWYGAWSQGDSSQWGLLTNRHYYFPPHKWFANRGKVKHIIIFPGRDIMRSDYEPYLSCTPEYVVNGGTSNDSMNILYGAASSPGHDPAWYMARSRGTVIHLIDSMHSVGGKVYLCLNAVTPTVGWNTVVSDSAKTQMFVDRFAQFIRQHSFDGTVVNVEQNPTPDTLQTIRFYRLLRQAEGMSTRIISSVPPPTWHKPAWNISNGVPKGIPYGAIQYHDYIMPQFYVYESGWTDWADDGSPEPCTTNCPTTDNQVFLSAPSVCAAVSPSGSTLHSIFCTHENTTGRIYNYGIQGWLDNGWPLSKMILLFTNQAMAFTPQSTGNSGDPYYCPNNTSGIDTMFSCSTGRDFWPDTLARHMLNMGGVDHWSDTYCGSWISGTITSSLPAVNGSTAMVPGNKFYIPYLSRRNIDSIFAKGRRMGIVNFGYYEVGMDCIMPAQCPNPLSTYISSLLDTTNAEPDPIPYLTISDDAKDFGTVTIGQSSTVQTITISGTNLPGSSGSVGTLHSSGFQLSHDGITWTGTSEDLVWEYTGGTLASQTVYIRFTPTIADDYSGYVQFICTGVANQTCTLTGTGTAVIGTYSRGRLKTQ